MNAKEARQKAMEITGETEKRQLKLVYNQIGESVDKGKLECNVYYSLLPAVDAQLKRDGYKTNYSSHRNESMTNISW